MPAQNTSIESLDDGTLSLVFQHLDLNETGSLMATNKRFSAFVNESAHVIQSALFNSDDQQLSEAWKRVINANDLASVKIMQDFIKPGTNNSFAIRRAAELGYTETVEYLLTLPEINPGANYNEAIRTASANGHYSVVELLLKSPKVNPTVKSLDLFT